MLQVACSRRQAILYSMVQMLTVTAACCFLFATTKQSVAADEFAVRNVDTVWLDDVYQLSADVYCPLSAQPVEALRKGVALTISLDIDVTKGRRYWLDEKVASLEQSYELRYHALTDQYLLTNLNSGVQHSFPSLQTALDVLGNIVDLPLLDRQLLEPDEDYSGRVRIRLDLDSLPAPLRLIAYFTPGWRQASDWYVWKLTM